MVRAERPVNFSYLAQRRWIEVFLVILLMPMFVLIALITCILIKLDSPGSILFSQMRPGKDQHLFKMYKFRSMYYNADASFLTLKSDQRVTRVGRLIRKFRIDELPQLFNVLKGDMSLIGPRPVPVNFLQQYENGIPDYYLRHRIRPGITGLAQVRQGYTNTVAQERQKLKYDLLYINSISYRTDLSILWSSIKALSK